MKFRTADYAHPPDRDRFTLGSVADIFTAPDDVQAKIVSSRVVNVFVIPSVAMVPDDEEITLGGIVFDRPLGEIDQHGGIAGIGLAEVFHGVFLQCLVFGEQIAARLRASCLSIELGNDVDVVGCADRFHFRQIGHAGIVEVIIAGEVDHNGPLFLFHSRLLQDVGRL